MSAENLSSEQEKYQGRKKEKRKPMGYKEYLETSSAGRHWLDAKAKEGIIMVWLVG